MACGHACGSTTVCARDGSPWNRDFVKVACSRPFSLNIVFAAVTHVAYTRFEADKGIMDALVGLREKAGAGGRGKTTAGEFGPATTLWGMLYACLLYTSDAADE